MHYFGGKFRIRKQLSQFLNEEINRNKVNIYFEPFVGGAWITPLIECRYKFSFDLNSPLISMYNSIQNGWLPPDNVSELEYKEAKTTDDLALKGFIGFGCSYAGKWFHGYAKDNTGRNYCKTAKTSLLKRTERMKNVVFECIDYSNLRLEAISNTVVYCDPPYYGTTQYDYYRNFNHHLFWEVIRQWSHNNLVYVSEYKAPCDFECVLEIETKTDMRNKQNKTEYRIEKLFTYKG